MKIIKEFKFEDDGTIICPSCGAGIIFPMVRKLVSFLCPLCHIRSVLEEAEASVKEQIDENPKLDPGR